MESHRALSFILTLVLLRLALEVGHCSARPPQEAADGVAPSPPPAAGDSPPVPPSLETLLPPGQDGATGADGRGEEEEDIPELLLPTLPPIEDEVEEDQVEEKEEEEKEEDTLTQVDEEDIESNALPQIEADDTREKFPAKTVSEQAAVSGGVSTDKDEALAAHLDPIVHNVPSKYPTLPAGELGAMLAADAGKREEEETDYPAYSTEEEIHEPSAPKYMVDLYNKFSTDKYSHPMANIVRSFMNVNEEEQQELVKFGNNTRLHTLVFNITSVTRDEELYLAELRLYTLVEADRKLYHGVNRRVSVYEVVQENNPYSRRHDLVFTKDIYGRYSGWETFTVTEAVRHWVKGQLESSSQVLEVRIDSVHGDYDHVSLDISMKLHNENEPLLVVFTNDKKKKKLEQREMQELIAQELEPEEDEEEEEGEVKEGEVVEDVVTGDDESEYETYYYFEDYEDFPFREELQTYLENLKHSVQKRDTSSVSGSRNVTQTRSMSEKQKQFLERIKSKITRQKKKEILSELYKQVMNLETEDTPVSNSTEGGDLLLRTKRSRRSRKKRARKKYSKRRICRRKPMNVVFEDINWNRWIIAPQSYQAYKCVGRCYFPLNDHLTPTKHAIIKSLLNVNLPRKTQRPCCVPTKLEPISILYVDDKGVVTYKYKYDGMVVSECGCR